MTGGCRGLKSLNIPENFNNDNYLKVWQALWTDLSNRWNCWILFSSSSFPSYFGKASGRPEFQHHQSTPHFIQVYSEGRSKVCPSKVGNFKSKEMEGKLRKNMARTLEIYLRNLVFTLNCEHWYTTQPSDCSDIVIMSSHLTPHT